MVITIYPPLMVLKEPASLHHHPHLVLSTVSILAVLMVILCGFNLHFFFFLVINKEEHFLRYIMDILVSFLVKCLLKLYIFIWLSVFFLLICEVFMSSG